MKKMTLFFALAMVVLASCKKDDACPFSESGATATVAEKDSISSYLAHNGLTATPHPSGVFYNISTQGTGNMPSICSGISFRYSGKFMASGVQFDATSGSEFATFQLGELIVGWQKALPFLKAGGRITIYIPPSLGYGSNNVPSTGPVVIPGNSYLKFDIELVDVQ